MSVHDLPFERLVDLSELATGPTPQRLELFAATLSPPPWPVRRVAPDGTERTEGPDYRSMVPAVRVYALPGHLLGRGGAARGDSVFWREDCHSNHLRDAFDGANGSAGDRYGDWYGAIGDPTAEIVDVGQPIAAVLQPNADYGRALVEILPRLWLVDHLARMGRPLAVALDTDAPKWLAELVGVLVPPERLVRFEGRHQLLRAPAVVVPSMMQVDDYLHPAFNVLVEAVLDRVFGNTPRQPPFRRLFLATGGDGAEVLRQRLGALGFEILFPAEMSFADRVRACAEARVIVSEGSTFAADALFAPIGSVHVALARHDALLERIIAARGQRLGIVEAADDGHSIDVDALIGLVERMDVEPAVDTPGPRPAQLTIAVSPDTVATGLYVAALTDIGDLPQLAPAARVALPAFLHADAVDPALSPYARLFHEPGPHAYATQAVVCGRLGGGSLLGDSGLALWRGRLVADSVDSGDFSRATGVTLVTGEDGRPVATPLDRRSHPGRKLFAGYTGRWAEDAGFLAECLPRLVASTRLVASGAAITVCVPASAPGSIQARAIELLGIADVAIVAPDQVATGSQLWLPSRIDPWTASPLVVDAAHALSALIPPGEHPTPTRLYLRARSGVRPPLAGFDALETVLGQHGFATVTLADYDLDTRVRLLRGAEFVVGEAAGGLAHIAFCRPGTRVLELFNPASVQPTHYVLAALGGLGYGFVVGQHVAEPAFEQPSLASGYAVTPDQLAAALADLLRPAPTAAPVVERPGALPLDEARRLTLPAPFFAAPALPELTLLVPVALAVPHAGLAIDARGERRPAEPDATRIDGDVIATLAPAPPDAPPDATSLAALPRLLAARTVRERHPAARVVLPPSGPARRIGELLGLADTALTMAPDATLTAETLWVVDGIDAADALPPNLLRRCGEAMREAVPPIDAEAMGVLPTRVHLCATAPDPLLDQALSPRAFVPVVWPSLSVDEQVRLMRVARRIVIEPGMANALMLAHPGACVLEAGLPTARALAAVCGLKYGCVGEVAQLGAAVAALLAEPLAEPLAA